MLAIQFVERTNALLYTCQLGDTGKQVRIRISQPTLIGLKIAVINVLVGCGDFSDPNVTRLEGLFKRIYLAERLEADDASWLLITTDAESSPCDPVPRSPSLATQAARA